MNFFYKPESVLQAGDIIHWWQDVGEDRVRQHVLVLSLAEDRSFSYRCFNFHDLDYEYVWAADLARWSKERCQLTVYRDGKILFKGK